MFRSTFLNIKRFSYSYSSNSLLRNRVTNSTKLLSIQNININNRNDSSIIGETQLARNIFFSSYISNVTDYQITKEDEMFSEIEESKTYERRGNFVASRSILGRSLEMTERMIGKKNPITLNILFRLINCEMAIGELSRAQQLANTVLERVDLADSSNDRYTIPSLNNLILCNKYQGNLQLAESNSDKLITLARDRGNRELEIGTLLNKAIIQGLQCNDECQKLFEEAMILSNKYLEPTHPLNEIIYGNYGSYCHSVEKDEMAESLYKKAIESAQSNNNQKELSNILTNYSEFLLDSEQLDRAEEMLKLASAKAEEVYGRQSAKLGSVIYIMAKLYRAKGNAQWAEGFFNRCITIFEDHKNLSTMAQKEQAQKERQETPQYQAGKREIELRTNKEVDIDYGNVLWDFAQMLREKGRVPEAVNLEQRARKLNALEDDE
ncbi:hypothetical protein PPL_05690 [Heterostelium album PN500]|uniref:Uncharacterized protein n=1 Tax=Heterostelium pallidum (strain ATCC 26659 / Pp 5 / PN500) TaxID=670386 RepID=D3BAV9_HETP5|nr:hypothetical protein PPL_05690 [Heterostelium album PN500]EFA81696.1 hypothetical protein PPL_05690 [Heterostelium album PN500]|eukprot:XP_020433813.1 hypothetical protein PPL_05690 [Heterostelium album PN500]